jgi:hypothetical protein
MKQLLRKTLVLTALAAGLICMFFAACTEPSPLYGTWADNRGNTFSFFDDDTFNAKINTAGGIIISYEGNYTVLLNALTLNCTNVELRVVTEWDIRGNMLYLDWINEDGVPLSLTLYKISN